LVKTATISLLQWLLEWSQWCKVNLFGQMWNMRCSWQRRCWTLRHCR